MTTDQPQRIGPIARRLVAALNATPAPARPTASEITDDQLDQLHADLDTARSIARDNYRAGADVRDERDLWCRVAEELSADRDRYRAAWCSARHRAEKAAAALDRVRTEHHRYGADSTASPSGDAWCHADDEVWPCPTILALGGEQAEPEECRVVEVDGVPVRVRGTGEMTDTGRRFLAEVVAAAKRRHAAEQAEPAPAAAEAAVARVRARCQEVRDQAGVGGMINACQVLGLLSPTWPDGNYVGTPPTA